MSNAKSLFGKNPGIDETAGGAAHYPYWLPPTGLPPDGDNLVMTIRADGRDYLVRVQPRSAGRCEVVQDSFDGLTIELSLCIRAVTTHATRHELHRCGCFVAWKAAHRC